MAVMHPEDYLERYDPKYSEQKLYEALRTQLPGEYHVFYSVRWFARRLDSEADFVVVDPERGFLCVEVKGGEALEAPETEDGAWILTEKRETEGRCAAGNREPPEYERARRKLKRSPYRQAENSMIYLRDCFEGRVGGGPKREFKGIYGFAVALPMFNPEFTSPTMPRELTITRDDLESGALRRRINEIFDFCGRLRERNLGEDQTPGPQAIRRRIGKNQRLNLGPQLWEFVRMLEEEQGLQVAAGALVEIKEREFSRIDFVQDSLLDMIRNCHRALICGGAGSGKTFIAMKKALRDLGRLGPGMEGRQVLLLSSSQELMDFIGGWLEDHLRQCREDWEEPLSRCCVCTYESLIRETLGEETAAGFPRDRRGNPTGCESQVRAADGRRRYDTIIVDEGQDFGGEMARTIRLFLRDPEEGAEESELPELYVFCDPEQDTSGNRTGRRIAQAFGIENPPFILSRNIRNTGRIYDYAKARSGKGRETSSNTLLGVEPRIYPVSAPGAPGGSAFYSDEDQCRRRLESILRELTDQRRGQVDSGSVVVLSDDPYESSLLAGRQEIGGLRIVADCPLRQIQSGELCFRTVEQFKGLEANVVIYIENVRGRPEDLSELERSREGSKAYIALTRAKYFLYVLRIKR